MLLPRIASFPSGTGWAGPSGSALRVYAVIVALSTSPDHPTIIEHALAPSGCLASPFTQAGRGGEATSERSHHSFPIGSHPAVSAIAGGLALPRILDQSSAHRSLRDTKHVRKFAQYALHLRFPLVRGEGASSVAVAGVGMAPRIRLRRHCNGPSQESQ
jgi:hypothetical protein